MMIILPLNHFLFRRNSKVRMSARSLATDVPKQVGAPAQSNSTYDITFESFSLFLAFRSLTLSFLYPVCLVSELVIQRQSQGPRPSLLHYCVLLPSVQLQHRPAHRTPTSAPAFVHTEPVYSAPAAASVPRASCQTSQPYEGRTCQGSSPISLRFSRCPQQSGSRTLQPHVCMCREQHFPITALQKWQ